MSLSKSLRVVILITGILVLWFGFPYIRSYLLLFTRYNSLAECYSMPEPPHPSDPKIPAGDKTSLDLTIRKLVYQDMGNELIYTSSEFPARIILWLRNLERFKITQQKAHWNPKIEASSHRIFAKYKELQEIEYRMYFNDVLTYWISVPRNSLSNPEHWQLRRYSECIAGSKFGLAMLGSGQYHT